MKGDSKVSCDKGVDIFLAWLLVEEYYGLNIFIIFLINQ